MANTPVEVKKAALASAPDSWRSFRTEMDRLFDRFAGGWGMPSLRRMFGRTGDALRELFHHAVTGGGHHRG